MTADPRTNAVPQYAPDGFWDEMFARPGEVRPHYARLARRLATLAAPDVAKRQRAAELSFQAQGITFAVNQDASGPEKTMPFDLVPRIVLADEWARIERGLQQRVRALNLFLHDIYHDQKILRAGLIPSELVLAARGYRREFRGVDVPLGVYTHVVGSDLVRDGQGTWFVLEDNLRVPSGVSYVVENRRVLKRVWPQLFTDYRVRPVEGYPQDLLEVLRSAAPGSDDPTVVLLTPGVHNSAFFEHAFLAKSMGIDLVQGSDLFVDDASVYMRTTRGRRRVDVIYRRVDDDFLDPLTFRPDSALGVPGLMSAYSAGNITLANAVGTGIADDKAVYSYMPEIVKFYLGEEPILKNVPTWRCREPKDLAYVLDNLGELVVKEVHGSGGYGMLIGPAATKATIEAFRDKLKRDPEGFIAQPTLALSTCPTCTEAGLAPRHVDLRPFVLTGSNHVTVVPGGLTRVALKEGSLVVNSSQGGGTKDTWILDE